MTEALTLLVAIYAVLIVFAYAALALGGRADLRAQHEMQSLIRRTAEGRDAVHTHFDTRNGKRNHG